MGLKREISIIFVSFGIIVASFIFEQQIQYIFNPALSLAAQLKQATTEISPFPNPTPQNKPIAYSIKATQKSSQYNQQLTYNSNATKTASILGAIHRNNSNTNKRFAPQTKTFGSIKTFGPKLTEEPANRESTIMIPKINVNNPIELNVSVSDKKEYNKALESGVAHAEGTKLPDEQNTTNTNTYLFAHSTAFEEDIAKYAAVFTKLKDLEKGDKIILFYKGKRHDYELNIKEIVPSFDTTVLTRNYDKATITLQTCDPPGIPLNRLIVTAHLVGIYDE